MKLEILIAEDDPHTRAALAEVLQGEGHVVTTAADGHQAKFLFDRHRPQFACLDVMMPGWSGFDLCRYFRSVEPTMPILFITAKADEIDKVVGLELGADDYIVKPFGTREIIARIRAIARRSIHGFESKSCEPQLPECDFEMGDLKVMPKQMRAKRDDKTIELTLRETRILQLLASKPGEVVERDELFRVAWQEDHFPSTRTLDQTISQLRKRIERDIKHPQIIQTVYGVGYRFDTPT